MKGKEIESWRGRGRRGTGSLPLPSFKIAELLSSPGPNDFASVPRKSGAAGVLQDSGNSAGGVTAWKSRPPSPGALARLAAARRDTYRDPRGCCLRPDLRWPQSPAPALPPHAVSRSHRSLARGTPSTLQAQPKEPTRGTELAPRALPGPSLRVVGARQLPSGSLPFCAQSQSGETSVFHKPRAEANPGLDARAHATADRRTKSRGQTRKLVPSSRTTRMTKAAAAGMRQSAAGWVFRSTAENSSSLPPPTPPTPLKHALSPQGK